LSDVLLAKTSIASIRTSKLGNLTNGAPSACFISSCFNPRLPVIDKLAGLFLVVLKAALILPSKCPDGTVKFSFMGAYSKYLAISSLSMFMPSVLSCESLNGTVSPAR